MLAIPKEEFVTICMSQGKWNDLKAFLENNIDSYVKTINNKNLVNAEMTEGEDQSKVPNGFGGCKT